MTREQYLMLRQRQDFNIVYEYYKKKFDHNKHMPFLSIMELPQALLATGFAPSQLFGKCCEHYDKEFNVVQVIDKDGALIKVL
jgi:hypothetical protein